MRTNMSVLGKLCLKVIFGRNLAFLACELKSCVNVYAVDELTGNLTQLQQVGAF
jgi:6-phosphogluconolactonase (cycloisomerase 2 family)